MLSILLVTRPCHAVGGKKLPLQCLKEIMMVFSIFLSSCASCYKIFTCLQSEVCPDALQVTKYNRNVQ